MATLLILAILTIGAVSASDDVDSSYLSDSDVNILADDEYDLDDDYGEDDDDLDDDYGEDDDEEYENLYVFSDVDAENVYYSENNTIIAYLKDLPSTATGTFYISEGDFQLAQKTVVNGQASFKLSELIDNLPLYLVGDHDFNAVYDDGENIYTKSIHVTIVEYKIILQSDNICMGENAVFKFILPSDVDGSINVYENEEFVASKEVSEGVAIITLSGLSLGSHDFWFEFSNDNFYLDDYATVVVAPKKITTVNNAYIGADNFFSVSLPGNANGLLSVEVKNLKTRKITTIDVKYTNGKAVVPASKLSAGNYAIIDFCIEDKKYGDYYYVDLPTYKEDAIYTKFNVVYPKFSLNKITTLKRTKSSLTLKATLGKVNGKYLKGKQITFKFNTKTYKVNTNSKGVAKITISKSLYKNFKAGKKISYQATYFKKTVKYTLKIK